MATAEKPATATPEPGAPRTAADFDPTVEQILAERRRRFTVEEYYQMAEAGILSSDERVELIDGEILLRSDRSYIFDGDLITVSSVGSRHASRVTCLCYLLNAPIGSRALVSVHRPVRLNNRSEPEPDVVVLKPHADSYRNAHPGPSDVFLVLEVIDSSADSDRTVKLGLYARFSVPEVWLVDLNRELIEVYRRPDGGAYTETRELARGESLAPEAFPDVVLGVDAILG